MQRSLGRPVPLAHRHVAGRAHKTMRARLAGALVALLAVSALTVVAASDAGARAATKAQPNRSDSGFLPGSYVSNREGPGRFPLVAAGKAAPLVVDSRDYPGVVRVVGDLRSDIEEVTGVAPTVSHVATAHQKQKDVVLIGTIGKSTLIDRLIRTGRLDVRTIVGKWETSLETVVTHPLPGVHRAFVIAGSDQRGTIYGAYDLSKTIGVSPWSWWDDVPAQHHHALYVLPGRHTQGTPVVKYRGFFINDENPQTGNWAATRFGAGLAPGYPGGLNHKYYAKIFELALRLKANYIWPAVWGRAFALDDPQNQATATRYGVVMGTSHEAPMTCGIEEWNRFALPAVRDSNGKIVTPGHDPYGGTGEWSFRYNAPALKKYWTSCIQRMVDQQAEMVVTLGMRGPGDVALADNTGIDLMRQIIDSQRKILARVTGKNVTTIPQVWTLYKEVLRYWNEGLRPPDDVTVVFTDDNWGNIRQLPDQKLPHRSGGYGLYYHFDYVGGGRNYKWLDTINLANTWDQLHQAYAYGDSRLWMVNVGDVKNEELPLQFFLDYAWNPNAIPLRDLDSWVQRYAGENFGARNAKAIAAVLEQYGQLQSRRKPELLNRKISIDPSKDLSTDPSAVVYDDQGDPFSLTDYREMDRVTSQWQRLAARTDAIGHSLPQGDQDAYYELVRYEVDATANLYAFRQAEFTNILYARQGRSATNTLATRAQRLFAKDQAMADYYNHDLAGGKWTGWQTQPHIDYGDVARYGPDAPWQQPQINNVAIPDVIFPAVGRIKVPTAPDLGVAIDGSERWWPHATAPPVLPEFSPYQTQPAQYIDVFNRGQTPFHYRIAPAAPWVHVTHRTGTVDDQVRATVRVDWSQAPAGRRTVPITVSGNGQTVVVQAPIDNPTIPRPKLRGFVEANGYVAMPADGYSRAVGTAGVWWQRIPGIGRTGAGMEPFPVTTSPRPLTKNSPRLKYTMTLTSTGPVKIWADLSPRNDILAHGGLRYAISVDNETPKVVNIQKQTGADDATMNRQWERNTSDNVNRTVTTHVIDQPGVHTVTFWMIDPTVVLQRLVVDAGGLEGSYLGPPSSRRITPTSGRPSPP